MEFGERTASKERIPLCKKDRGSMGMNLIAGDSLYGTIDVRGNYELKLQRLGSDKVITDDIGISVYLT